MRVHVADLARIDSGVGKRHLHRPRRVLAGRIGLGHVRRIRGDPVPRQLAIDLRPALPGLLELLEHEHRSRLAHHETIALRIEGT